MSKHSRSLTGAIVVNFCKNFDLMRFPHKMSRISGYGEGSATGKRIAATICLLVNCGMEALQLRLVSPPSLWAGQWQVQSFLTHNYELKLC